MCRLVNSAKIFTLVFVLLFAVGCKTSRYAKSDKVYKNLAKGYAKLIEAAPPINQGIDSLQQGAQLWVGTVNVGIRRANFVIMHHTAQDSVAQTLMTFSTPRTQVSAHFMQTDITPALTEWEKSVLFNLYRKYL